jgi:alpha-ribazole phosphatase
MRLYLIRHPKPIVAVGTCYGSTDLAVAPEEHIQVAAALGSVLPPRTALFSSPLQRAAQLADHLAQALDCAAPVHDVRLVEMHFGAWEMQMWDQIARAEIDAWTGDMVHYRPGGGENVLQMAQRVLAFHQDMLRSNLDSAAVVCHAGTIRMLLACGRGLSLSDMALHAAQTRHAIDYGEVIVLDY